MPFHCLLFPHVALSPCSVQCLRLSIARFSANFTNVVIPLLIQISADDMVTSVQTSKQRDDAKQPDPVSAHLSPVRRPVKEARAETGRKVVPVGDGVAWEVSVPEVVPELVVPRRAGWGRKVSWVCR